MTHDFIYVSQYSFNGIFLFILVLRWNLGLLTKKFDLNLNVAAIKYASSIFSMKYSSDKFKLYNIIQNLQLEIARSLSTCC